MLEISVAVEKNRGHINQITTMRRQAEDATFCCLNDHKKYDKQETRTFEGRGDNTTVRL